MKIRPVKYKKARVALTLAAVAASGVLSGCDVGVKTAGDPAVETTTTSQIQTEGIYTTSATTTTAVGTYTTSVSTPRLEGTSGMSNIGETTFDTKTAGIISADTTSESAK